MATKKLAKPLAEVKKPVRAKIAVAGAAKTKKANPTKDALPLTHKQEQFCRAMASGMNQSDAYRAAYDAKSMKPATVQSKACLLMADGKVRARVSELSKKAAERAEITAADVLIEAMRLAKFDIRKLYKADGSPVPIHELDDDTAAAVQAVDYSEEYIGTGKDRVFVGYTKKYKVADKNSALDKLFKHFGLFEKDNAQKNPITDLTDEQLARFIARKAKEAGLILH